MSRRAAAALALLTAALGVNAAAVRADVPVQRGAPWPSMRHDGRNTGASAIPARYAGDRPWRVRTGKGIFSTPIVGADGTVYVGSADTFFYAIAPDGTVRWRLKTGNIIDSAAVIGRYDPGLRTSPLSFGSADESLYHLGTNPRRCRAAGSPRCAPPRIIWRFRPTVPPVPGQLVDWWEGNVALGPDGTLYAGNTGGGEYAITPAGRQRWVFLAGNSIWTNPAFASDGRVFVGSLDLHVYALDRDGRQVWSRGTAGFVISSSALGRDGTVYVGSFDGRLYALDGASGAVKWTFRTNDNIYSSPALAEDARGMTTAVFIASTDGSVYALSPAGKLLWRYDTGDVIRSSPVLGRGPGGRGRILYVGNGAGTLFALDAHNGRRRWSYDTTMTDPVLRDRNDLNASPALGRRGIYIGSEDGSVDYVPYDYCLHRADRRCSVNAGEPLPRNLARVFALQTGGGTAWNGLRRPLSIAAPLVGRLVVRRNGRTVSAAMTAARAATLVHPSPRFRFDAELSADGHYIFVRPRGFLRPSTRYSVRISGRYTTAGEHVGSPGPGGTFASTIAFRTAAPPARLPLSTSRRRVSAFNLRRFAVPLPAFVTSVNQIGFDSYDMIAGTLAVSHADARGEGSVLLWVVGGRRNRSGVPVADPRGNFAFPLAGRYRGGSLTVSDANFPLTFSFGTVPLERFELRMDLPASLTAKAGAGLYAQAFCPGVPHYGPLLIAAGLCNSNNRLPVGGTFITSAYDPAGPANKRPRGLSVARVSLARPASGRDGSVDATFSLARGARYPAALHTASILLTDAATGAVVALDYRKLTTVRADGRGDLAAVRVGIPAGTPVPRRVRAYVVTDVYPLRSLVL